jgi:hypothetical protein
MAATPPRHDRSQGITNVPVDAEPREQDKLPPRPEGIDEEDSSAGPAQHSAGKVGTQSDARKRASASRGGKAPGKARPKPGAAGAGNRRPANVVKAKRGTTGAAG